MRDEDWRKSAGSMSACVFTDANEKERQHSNLRQQHTRTRKSLDADLTDATSASVKSVVPETAALLDARLLPPSEQQLFLLRKVLAAGMVDRLAK